MADRLQKEIVNYVAFIDPGRMVDNGVMENGISSIFVENGVSSIFESGQRVEKRPDTTSAPPANGNY
jgi:hypothetical protein